MTKASSGELVAKAGFHGALAPTPVIPMRGGIIPSLSLSGHTHLGNQKGTYLLKFTTPFGMPVGVSKAGRSFSPSLMAFIRNTCKGGVRGHCESWEINPPRH